MTPYTIAQILGDFAGAFGGRWADRADVWHRYGQGVSDDAATAACRQWIERNRTGPSLGAFLDAARLIQRKASDPHAGPDCPECRGARFHRVLMEHTESRVRFTAYQPCSCNPLAGQQRLPARLIRRIPEPYMPGSPEMVTTEGSM